MYSLKKNPWFWLLLLAVIAPAATVLFIRSQNREAVLRGLRQTTFEPSVSAYLILFGLTDAQPTAWDGSVSVSGGRLMAIEGWRFAADDATDGRSSWKLSTRNNAAASGGQMMENGILVTGDFSDSGTRLNVESRQGSFSFESQEIAWGTPKSFLDGRVRVERVTASIQLTNSPEEQDFPAVFQRGDDLWLAYVEFVHGDRSQAVDKFQEEPRDFSFLARPAGSDQVFLMHYSLSRRTWSGPIPVSAPHQDIMRTAVAEDREGRVWVFWAANQNGNFDIFARSLRHGAWSGEIRLTSDPGTDLNPVATADASGRVWVAWQGFRNDNLEILAAVQNGDGFSAEKTVSFSPADDWDPSIAADPNGDVAISWDTYDKGDYDVYFRQLRAIPGIQLDAPVPVAVSDRFEARSSIAYDPAGRLWVAYEGSSENWGKDFGAYAKSGVMLYWGHNIQVKCFQGSDAYTTASKLAVPGSLNSFPRLSTDVDGRVYLAYRTRLTGATVAGGIWLGRLFYFDGQGWNGPISLPHSDGFSDSRPGLVAVGGGRLLIVGAMDHRLSQTPGTSSGGDWINTDIYASELQLNQPASAPRLEHAASEAAAEPGAEAKAELDQVALMRNYRTTLNGSELRLMRGEFHRHTEISYDGESDGPLVDAYRYLLDSASMDWGGCCDHDNGGGREYNWWIEQKLTDAYHLGTKYVSMFSYERSVGYPEGHRNVVFVQRGVRPLPRLLKSAGGSPPPPAPDTQMLYHYLKQFDGVAASHTSATNMGTDWRDNDPILEPVVEIYQGDRQNYEMPDAPRSPTEDHALGGWRPLGFVSNALLKGFRLGFEASSDHISTHIAYCNLWVTAPTREGIMEALHERRVYGSTDNILAEVRSGDHFMGEQFTVREPPAISVRLVGTKEFSAVYVIKDNQYVYSIQPNTPDVSFTWRDGDMQQGTTSYYYVRGEQADGQLVWISPMWITYK